MRVVLKGCGQTPGVVASKKVMTGIGSQRSVAVAVGKLGTAVHSILAGAVGQTMIGAELSVTAMVWLHRAVFPQASVAVQVRVTE